MNKYLILATFILAGCASPPSVDMANPQAITVSYEASEGPGVANQAAQNWCAQNGKNAVPTTKSGVGNDWSYRVSQNYECR